MTKAIRSKQELEPVILELIGELKKRYDDIDAVADTGIKKR